MPNPYLPNWEYIPDGEPRVFGDRVYVYGSHDRPGSTAFCDYKLRAWSASIDDLEHWVCHGDSFHTRKDGEHESDVDWTDHELYAPDVIEKGGKYYLYFYILMAHGGVAVSDTPTGAFELLSKYKLPENSPDNFCESGIFVDPGMLVDDDGKVYIYCGYLRSYMAQLNPDNMYEVIDGTYQDNIIPVEEPFCFFEDCSPRKVGDTYYMIYSPKIGSRLVYAISKSPTGPFKFGGTIIDNGVDYPGGNDHGSICCINGQWYIFYHRMTNNTVMSRRACVEKIKVLPDGSIPQVEMTSLDFSNSLSPYQINSADLACVLIGGNFITEYDVYTHPVIENINGCIAGYKYYGFGDVNSSKYLTFTVKLRKIDCSGKMSIITDDYKSGTVIGEIKIGEELVKNEWATLSTKVNCVKGTHSLFFKFESENKDDVIAEIDSFIFTIDN